MGVSCFLGGVAFFMGGVSYFLTGVIGFDSSLTYSLAIVGKGDVTLVGGSGLTTMGSSC